MTVTQTGDCQLNDQWVPIRLEAEEETGAVHTWNGQVRLGEPLQILVDRWAADCVKNDCEFHGAGLEEPDRDGSLDLSRTPDELCWLSGVERILWVVPLSDLNAEVRNKENLASSNASAEVSARDGAPSKDTTPRKRAGPAPQPAKRAKTAAKVVDQAEPLLNTGEQAVEPCDDLEPVAATIAESPGPVKAVSATKTERALAEASHVVETPVASMSAKAEMTPVLKPEKPSSKAVVKPETKPASKADAAALTKKAGRGAASATVPSGDDPIVFVQTNPKRQGTTSHARYEKYKHAKTPNEALTMGCTKGDLSYDFGKGYYKLRDM
jgi:hypothetical protein